MALLALYGLVGQLQPGKGKSCGYCAPCAGAGWSVMVSSISSTIASNTFRLRSNASRASWLWIFQILIHVALQLRSKPLQLSPGGYSWHTPDPYFHNGIDAGKQKEIDPQGKPPW